MNGRPQCVRAKETVCEWLWLHAPFEDEDASFWLIHSRCNLLCAVFALLWSSGATQRTHSEKSPDDAKWIRRNGMGLKIYSKCVQSHRRCHIASKVFRCDVLLFCHRLLSMEQQQHHYFISLELLSSSLLQFHFWFCGISHCAICICTEPSRLHSLQLIYRWWRGLCGARRSSITLTIFAERCQEYHFRCCVWRWSRVK